MASTSYRGSTPHARRAHRQVHHRATADSAAQSGRRAEHQAQSAMVEGKRWLRNARQAHAADHCRLQIGASGPQSRSRRECEARHPGDGQPLPCRVVCGLQVGLETEPAMSSKSGSEWENTASVPWLPMRKTAAAPTVTRLKRAFAAIASSVDNRNSATSAGRRNSAPPKPMRPPRAPISAPTPSGL